MAIHPSLRGADKSKKQRSVLKRAERLKIMIDKGDWKDGDDIYGLPKIKTIRIKIKKEKAEKVETTVAGGATAAPAGTEAPKEQAKPQAKAQAPAAKAQEKK